MYILFECKYVYKYTYELMRGRSEWYEQKIFLGKSKLNHFP